MTVTPHFGPPVGLEIAVINQIAAAATRVWVMAYEFNAGNISIALANALSRGCDVKLIVDPRTVKVRHPAVALLRSAGITTYADDEHCRMHNKILIIDSHITITGSYNLTTQANNLNAENIVVIDDATVAAAYEAEFNTHLAHSIQYL